MSGELQNKYAWTDFTASTAGTAIDFQGFGLETSFYVETGAASSGVVTIKSGRSSNGPWATIASTTVSSTGAAVVMEVTGPLLWVQPTVASTGTWKIEAVSFG